jgi:hypothetical protein
LTNIEETGFNGRISACIDRALDLLGEGVKRSFYFQISERYKLPVDQFSKRPEEVIDHLREILGPGGSSMVEVLIVKEIREEFSLEPNNKAGLRMTIEDARKKFLDA